MLAIIDGDILAYLACKPRKKKTGTVQITSLDDAGRVVPEETTKEEDTAYLMASWANFQKDLDRLLESLFCTEYIMVMKGPGNFRDDLYVDYKANRANPNPNYKPKDFAPSIRKLALRHELTIDSDGREADDFVRIWAEEARLHGVPFIICSNDKDLQCIPGKYYNVKKKEMTVVTEEFARRHYYTQILKGDPTDNIPGVPGIGDKKAEKILADCETDEEFQEEIVSYYLGAYDDEWYEHLLINGKLIHIQTHMNDYFTADQWPVVKEIKGLE